ncbi:MAG TPA: ABC transporter permease, partial [Parafilimonas sp.]|nr:ABC transporter permease [Parafilimonas sp.]
MFKNHLKIAWRNLIKDKQFTFLNLLGLSVGLACTLMIYLWVNDEMSVDKFFAQDDQIYQLMEHRKAEGMTGISDESSGMLGEVLAERMPQIEYAAAVAPPEWFQKFTLTNGDKNIKASGQYAGRDYFNIFSFKLLDGKKNKVLADKNSIVISDELAKKLFGTTQNLIGKAIRFQQDRDFFISGVFQKPSSQSSQQFDFVLSFEYMKDIFPWVKTWNNTGPHNFVLLKKGTDINIFNKQIAGIVIENSGDTTRTAFATKFADNYLLNTFSHGSRTGGKIEYVRLFSLIAIFILLI